MSDNMFLQANRLKVRFEYKGLITAEDLWDLSLEALNSIYKSLKASAKQSEEGLLNTRKTEDDILDLKIALVTHVFEVKQQELNDRKTKVEKLKKKEKLKEILEQKQNDELKNMSVADISKLIDELDS